MDAIATSTLMTLAGRCRPCGSRAAEPPGRQRSQSHPAPRVLQRWRARTATQSAPAIRVGAEPPGRQRSQSHPAPRVLQRWRARTATQSAPAIRRSSTRPSSSGQQRAVQARARRRAVRPAAYRPRTAARAAPPGLAARASNVPSRRERGGAPFGQRRIALVQLIVHATFPSRFDQALQYRSCRPPSQPLVVGAWPPSADCSRHFSKSVRPSASIPVLSAALATVGCRRLAPVQQANRRPPFCPGPPVGAIDRSAGRPSNSWVGPLTGTTSQPSPPVLSRPAGWRHRPISRAPQQQLGGRRGSRAPLLLIASLCIVVGAVHERRSSSSLRSASSSARFTSAAPPHRFALHRRRRGSRAPLLLIASLCIRLRRASQQLAVPTWRGESAPRRSTAATSVSRGPWYRLRRASQQLAVPTWRGESAPRRSTAATSVSRGPTDGGPVCPRAVCGFIFSWRRKDFVGSAEWGWSRPTTDGGPVCPRAVCGFIFSWRRKDFVGSAEWGWSRLARFAAAMLGAFPTSSR